MIIDMKTLQYTKINNSLFYGFNEDNKDGLANVIKDSKIILLLDYLYKTTGRDGIARITIKDFLEDNNLNVCSKNSEAIKNILLELKKLNMIHFEKLKPKELIKIETNNLIEKDMNSNDIKYFQLQQHIKEKIFNISKNTKQYINLLTYYCYLDCSIHKRPNKADINITGGYAEVTWVNQKQISNLTNISRTVLSDYNNILVENKLISIVNLGKMYNLNDNGGTVVECNNIIALCNGREEDELREGVKQYKKYIADKGFKITQSKNKNKTNGEKGALIRWQNVGKLSLEQEHRLDELSNIKTTDKNFDANDYRFINKNILQDLNEKDEIILSSYYIDKDNWNKYNFYYNFEKEMGLIDTDGNLLVKYDYYKWVMCNYIDSEKLTYKKYIQEHKQNNFKRLGFINKNSKKISSVANE